MPRAAMLVALVLTVMPSLVAATLNDPMRPPAALLGSRPAPDAAPATPPAVSFHLTSTLVGGARRVAIINDALVGVGDEVEGARVLTIEPRAARIRYRGRVLVLRLGAASGSKR